jgi:hypothetical protein
MYRVNRFENDSISARHLAIKTTPVFTLKRLDQTLKRIFREFIDVVQNAAAAIWR